MRFLILIFQLFINIAIAQVAIYSPDTFTLPPPHPDVYVRVDSSGARKSIPIRDCSSPTLSVCSQGAWADVGLALSGVESFYDLCYKYTPTTSCVSTALAQCAHDIDIITKRMLLAVAKVLVHWCYDGGQKIREMDEDRECYAAAVLAAVTIDGCLIKDMEKPQRGLSRGFLVAKQSKQGASLTTVWNSFMGHYQMSTIQCLYHSLDLTCGKEKADLALAPALEEAHLARYTDPPPTTVSLNETFLDANGTMHGNFSSIAAEFAQVLDFNGSTRTATYRDDRLHFVLLILLQSFLIKYLL